MAKSWQGRDLDYKRLWFFFKFPLTVNTVLGERKNLKAFAGDILIAIQAFAVAVIVNSLQGFFYILHVFVKI